MKHIVVDGLQISNWDRSTLEEVQQGGVHGLNATCAVWDGTVETIRNIADWIVLARDNEDLVQLVTTSQEIRDAAQAEKVAVILGFQNTSPFEQDYSLVEVFHKLGVRIAQLTYNIQNYVGGSCYDPSDSGLTRFGTKIVSEMNRVGMLIDLSHVGNKTSLDAINVSESPVAITHANPLWFANSPRNKPDDVIKNLVERGGVIGACMYPNIIGGKDATFKDFSNMLLRLIDQVGIEHVAIGSDSTRNWGKHHVEVLRDGRWRQREEATWPEWPDWFKSPKDFPRLAEALSQSGISDEDLSALLGGNWLRLFDEVLGTSK